MAVLRPATNLPATTSILPDDYLAGEAGDDSLYGGEGADTLEGGAGNDVLQGDIPNRTIRGREFTYDSGVDTFVFAAGHGNDTINHFTDDEDLIDLTALSSIAGFNDLTITSGEDGAVIDLTGHGGGTIFLDSFEANDLDSDDFVFHDSGTESPSDGG